MPGGLLPVLQVVVEPRYAASDEQGVVVRSVAAVVLLPLCVITVEKELPGVSAAGIDVIPEIISGGTWYSKTESPTIPGT